MIEWLADNWIKIAIPLLAFLATCIVGLWLRRVLIGAFERWSARTKWEGSRLIAYFGVKKPGFRSKSAGLSE